MEERLEALQQAAQGLVHSLEDVEEQLETITEDDHEPTAQATHARCPRCGVENPLEAGFCGNCGASLAAARSAAP